MIPFKIYGSGMRKMHFAHANGYPSGCYRKFLKAFYAKYEILAMDSRPLWPNSSPKDLKNWSLFSDDLQQLFIEHKLENVVGLGHSLGGIYSLIAAHENPQMLSKLVLLEPVILEPKHYKLFKLPFFIKNRILPMMKVAKKRRNQWQTKEEAEEYFRSKRVYQRFDSDCFDDFLQYGLEEEQGKVRLAFPREWEARIYGSLSSVWHILKDPPCPLIIVRAEYSDVLNDEIWDQIKKRGKNITFITMANVGHMMPLEKPLQLANLIKGFL